MHLFLSVIVTWVGIGLALAKMNALECGDIFIMRCACIHTRSLGVYHEFTKLYEVFKTLGGHNGMISVILSHKKSINHTLIQ